MLHTGSRLKNDKKYYCTVTSFCLQTFRVTHKSHNSPGSKRNICVNMNPFLVIFVLLRWVGIFKLPFLSHFLINPTFGGMPCNSLKRASKPLKRIYYQMDHIWLAPSRHNITSHQILNWGHSEVIFYIIL